MDRPTNLMVINSMLLFDEQLDWDKLVEVVHRRLVMLYPRFRQRVVESRLGLRGAHWQLDPGFDLSRHIHRRGLPFPGDESALKELAGDLAAIPLDREKPLWEMYLIDGPAPGCAVITRMHHCIADGIALAGVLLSLSDSVRGQTQAPSANGGRWRGKRQAPIFGRRARALGGSLAKASAPVVNAITMTGQAARALAREGIETLPHPHHAVELANEIGADAQAFAKLMFAQAEPANAFKGQVGFSRSVTWSKPLPLQEIKAIGRRHGASVNDVLLSAVSGALRRYLLARGEQPHELRTMIPVNLRPLDEPVAQELGNRFGLVLLTLPVDRPGRRERLAETKRRMDEIKRSPEAAVSYAMLGAIGMSPQPVENVMIDIFSAKATAVVTNVKGPEEVVFFAGSPLRAVLVWAPTAGSVGMSVSIFSYHGAVTVGLLVHTHTVAEPQSIVHGVESELAAMARLTSTAKA